MFAQFLTVCIFFGCQTTLGIQLNLSPQERRWKQMHNPMELLSPQEQMELNAKQMSEFRKSMQGVVFSGVFTDNALLQREPYKASLYGAADAANADITVSMTDETSQQVTTYTTRSMDNNDWKVTLPKTYPNGGNFSFTVSCSGCVNNTATDTITNVTFGDVFFCIGQSNMQLEMFHSFSRNYTYRNISELAKYNNIRFFTSVEGGQANQTYVIPQNNKNNGEYLWNQVNSSTIPLLDLFSAACFYTAQTLSDNHSMSDINFGLVDTAVGGSIIESWMLNHTVDYHCMANTTACPGPGCGGLYNGMVLPWVNMTIRSVLWYQGENDVGRHADHEDGNILNASGYACMERLLMTQLRSNWSTALDNDMLPFGVVTLASGTSEGNQAYMGTFRWNQMLNYGVLPPPQDTYVSGNTFVIQAHDIGDPWGTKKCTGCHFGSPYSPKSNETNATTWYMGPIHPRPKIFVGRRLARGVAKFVYGVDEIYSGPVLAGCAIDDETRVLSVMFNKTLMYGEDLFYQKFDAWYNKSLQVEYQNAMMLNVKGKWTPVKDEFVSVEGAAWTVNVNVSAFYGNGSVSEVVGVRYAFEDAPCCGDLDRKLYPCPMNMCPFQSAKTRLPAVPFWAKIVNNKCKCFAPQVC